MRTGPDGRFRLGQAPAGPVPFEVSAEGFSTEQLEEDLVLVSGKETSLRLVLNPGMKSGQIRIVLTWGLEPADLDAHLEGPLPDGKRFHIFFQQKGDLKSREFVNLDVDAKDGKGPETITVLGVSPGSYHYFVHDYTNRDVHRSTALARSGAEVRVYHGGQTYRFRANNESAGTIWNVCDIDVTPSGAAVVKKLDKYETRSIAAAVDLVFLLDVSPLDPEYLRQRTASCLDERGGTSRPGSTAASVSFLSAVRREELLRARSRRRTIWRSSGSGWPVRLRPELHRLPRAPPLCTKRRTWNFDPGAAVQFVLMTVPPARHTEELAATAMLLKQRNVKTTVYAAPNEQELYRPLYEQGGLFRAVGEASAPAAAGPRRPVRRCWPAPTRRWTSRATIWEAAWTSTSCGSSTTANR